MSAPSNISVDEKKENLQKLRAFHMPTLDKLGVSPSLLIGKMAYIPTGNLEVFVSFFHSELSKGQDIYIEFTDRNNVPEDTKRTLYLWRYNPYFLTEYQRTEEQITNATRFYVPVSELKTIKSYVPGVVEKVEEKPKEEIIMEDFDLPNPEIDPPINEMTIRDLAAIMLNKPVSKKDWLNIIIVSNK